MAYTDIDKPSDYFNTVLYTGTGTTQNVTGVGFNPDFVWVKSRSNAYNHTVWDRVRGAGQRLIPNLTDAEETQTGDMSAFITDGITVNGGNTTSGNGFTYAMWNWLAGGTAVSNTDGSITSSVSANTTSGFSIVSYTGNATNGATVGHGLSSAPQMVITKNREDAGTNWQVLTNIYPNYSEGDYINLNDIGAKANSVNVSFLPTSTTWQMKSGQAGNVAKQQIAYCFHSVKGFSKFGSYTGNGSSDGTFVYTGFKPAWVMVKRTDSAEGWNIGDNKRNITFPSGANVNNAEIQANLSNAETDRSIRGGGTTQYDILSNGFKFRGNNPEINTSGGSYIYMAFAQNPLVGSNGVPCTAR